MTIKKLGTFLLITVFIVSCASLGTKTLFLEENNLIQTGATISICKPILINNEATDTDVQEIIKSMVSSELKTKNIHCETLINNFIEFDKIEPKTEISIPNSVNTDYILFTKLERLVALNITRDYEVCYKLVSVKDRKLVFYSAYNTTFGATMVVIPGIKNYPNTDQIMLIGIKSGLHDLKRKMISM